MRKSLLLGLARVSGKPHPHVPPTPAPAVPVNTSPPTITGTAGVGYTLALSNGLWTNIPTSYTRQWSADGVDIGGATSSTYSVLEADEGKAISGRVLASNAAGPALSAAVAASVGPVSPAATGIPPCVNAPTVGTDLTTVWGYQFWGTGPRHSAANGTWGGALDAYLIGKGFVIGNTGALYLNVGSGTVTVADYDFADGPPVHVGGTGAAIFNDCTSNGDASKGVSGPKDINGSFDFDGSTLTITLNYCLLDKSITYLGSGTMVHNFCRVKNQVQVTGGTAYDATGASRWEYNDCFISGGGIAPATNAHVELLQSMPNLSAPTCYLIVRRTIINFVDGQVNTLPWNSAWTGVFAVGKVIVEFIDSIFLGITEVNLNSLNPNVINCLLAYGTATGTGARITNCIMQAGRYGYTLNQNATSNRVVDGGGNRTDQNVPLTAADFG